MKQDLKKGKVRTAQSKSGKIHVMRDRVGKSHTSACGNLESPDATVMAVKDFKSFDDVCQRCRKSNLLKEQEAESWYKRIINKIF